MKTCYPLPQSRRVFQRSQVRIPGRIFFCFFLIRPIIITLIIFFIYSGWSLGVAFPGILWGWFPDNFLLSVSAHLLHIKNYTLKKVQKKFRGGLGVLGDLYGHAEWIKTRHLTEQTFDWRLWLGDIDENMLLWWPLTIYIVVQLWGSRLVFQRSLVRMPGGIFSSH